MKTSWDTFADGMDRGIDVNAQAVVFRVGTPPYEGSNSCTHAQFLAGHLQDHLNNTFGHPVVVEVIAAVLALHPHDEAPSEAKKYQEALYRALDRAITNGEVDSLELIIQSGVDLNRRGYYGMTPLMDACTPTHPTKFQIMALLLRHGADPNIKDNGGNNVLMRVLAGHSGTRDELGTLTPLLLDHGLDINAKNTYGQTVLQIACFWGRLDVVQHLMQRGVDIREADKPKKSLLAEVMSGGNCRPRIPGQYEELVRLFIENGADVNSKGDFGDSVLMFACEQGYLALADFLLARGADINQVNDHVFKGRTALMSAAWAGQVEAVKLLLAHDAGVNVADSGKETALFKAANRGYAEVVWLLLDNGADVHARDWRGNTPLLHAAWSGHTSIVELLLDRGADVNARNKEGWNALMQSCMQGFVKTAALLVARGSEVNVRGEEKEAGATPLMLACWKDSVEVVNLLLHNGANVHFKDVEGKTAFERVMLSTLQYSVPIEIVRALLEAGADREIRLLNGCTPLSIATIKGDLAMMKLLLEQGSQVNAPDDLGVTPLMEAAMYGYQDAVEWLLLYDAEVNAKAKTGKTAFAFASEGGHAEIARLLAAAREGAAEEKAEGPICSFEACPICQDLPDSVSADRARSGALD